MLLRNLRWILAAAISITALAQPAPAPRDPYEFVTGRADPAATAASRNAARALLDRARSRYGVRQAGLAYDLKVSFTVDSHGQTLSDGAWQMEDIADPNQGLRWTATSSSGFTTTQISANGEFYGEGTPGGFPLRLQEARAALFDPMPSGAAVARDFMRTTSINYNGTPLTCVLLNARAANTPDSGRRWEETEECIDPQTGLLRLHSQAPGRYYVYDYSNAPQLGVYLLPHSVTVTEGGEAVSTITVDSLAEIPAADPSLFTPSQEMLANGPPPVMAEAQKMSGFVGRRPARGSEPSPIYVFGLVNSSGKLVEAHSLQPSDPNSAAAVGAAQHIPFASDASGSRPHQHFVFILETFNSN